MKRLAALMMIGIMAVPLFHTVEVEATPSADAMIDMVIDKMMREKESGNTLYYDLIMTYKNDIDQGSLVFLYNQLGSSDKARVKEVAGVEDVVGELQSLSNDDINKIQNRLTEIETGGSSPGGSTGGGAGGQKQPEAVAEEKHELEESIQTEGISFADIEGLWEEAQEAIEFMVARGVLNGKAEGVFAPYDHITRAEFAKTIVALFDLKTDNSADVKEFQDVKGEDWYYDYVKIASQHGIIQGRTAESFAPNANVTRQEMAVMITRAMKVMGRDEIISPLQAVELIDKYEDGSQVGQWARNELAIVINHGIIRGKTDASLAPLDEANRAEAVTILKRLYDLLD